jgi:hypothetical protein
MGFSLGDAFGSIFGGGGGSEQRDSTTEPWKEIQPYLLDAYKQSQNLYQSGGPEYYPNATYTQFSPQTQMAMQLGENRALFGSQFDPAAGNVAMSGMSGNSPYNQAAMDSLWGSQLGMAGLSPTVQGQFLNSNPYLDNMFNAASRSVGQQYSNTVMPGINATFGSGGRTGSNAHQTALDTANQSYTNNLTDMASNIYGNNYANERTNQLNAANQYANLGQNLAQQYSNLGGSQFNQQLAGANLGMQLGQQDWNNIDRLGYIGQQVEGQGQKVLDDYMNRFNYYQNRPEQNLQNYIGFLNGNPGSNASQTNVDTENGSQTMDFAKSLATAFFLSDARLKSNVRKVGSVNGFNWYSWTWNAIANAMGLSGDSQGVIAQEVEAIAPNLIGEIGGYKSVNYGGII